MNQPNPTPPKSDEWNEDHVCPTCRIGVKYINKDLTEVELTMKTPRYVTDEEIDAMWPINIFPDRNVHSKAMRDKIFNNVKLKV